MAIELAALSESTLTDRYQTTIPEPVRKFLGLNKRDKIRYTIQSDGQVVISRINREEDDPILGEFLNFLAKDIEKHPDRVRAIDTDLLDRVRSLTAPVELDLDSPLSDEDE
jgi:antitoxin PrlF